LWFVASGLPGAIGGAIVVGYIPRQAFDWLFAGVLSALGVWLVTRGAVQRIQPPVSGRTVVQRMLRDREGNTFLYAFPMWKGVAISAAVGFVSSLLGIGGGVVHVPVMATVLHFPVHIAAATSHFVLAFMSAEGTAVHVYTGTLSWDQPLARAVLIGAGAIPGAQLGAWIARRVHGGVIIRALAGALVLVGARLALKAISE
jgi:hypothetical protein